MKNKKNIWIFAILAIVLGWSLLKYQQTKVISTPKPLIAEVKATNLVPQTPATNTAEPSFATVTATNDSMLEAMGKDIDQRYRQGLISKDQAMKETILAENLKPQDFYGKAVDQYGDPIVNANVSGNLIVNDGTYGGFNVKKYTATTDGNGLFEFVGIHGASLNVLINKNGYKMGDRGEGYKDPAGGRTSPTDRAILTMWKLRGAEPLTSSGIDAKIPHDGSPVTFEMATGKVSPNGDLRVTLSQFPLEVRTGREKFDWALKVEIINGGLIEENDPYPYWAPANGYQPSYEFDMSSNAVKWLPDLKTNFYIKNAQGQYGIMHFSIYPGRSPTGLEVNFTINPSGSQNLEPNFSK